MTFLVQGQSIQVDTQFHKGDRIVLDVMKDAHPVESGTRGTVTSSMVIYGKEHVGVVWDNGRQLSLIIPPDAAHLETETP